MSARQHLPGAQGWRELETLYAPELRPDSPFVRTRKTDTGGDIAIGRSYVSRPAVMTDEAIRVQGLLIPRLVTPRESLSSRIAYGVIYALCVFVVWAVFTGGARSWIAI